MHVAPPARGGRRSPWVLALRVAGLTSLLTGVALVTVALERPHIIEVTLVPGPGGAPVAHWSIAGGGTRTFAARDARGRVIEEGELREPRGFLPLPHDVSSVRVAVANAFGSDARDVSYDRPAPAPPSRNASAVQPRVALEAPRPGRPFIIRYDIARGSKVRVSILDRSGALWFAASAGSGRGTLRLPMPPAGPGEPYALEARALDPGGAETTLFHVPAIAAKAPSAPSLLAAPERPSSFIVHPDPAVAGSRLAVRVPSSGGGHVEIVRNGDGAWVGSALLRPGEHVAVFKAPPRGAYTVRVTLRRAGGNETLVRPLHFGGS